MDEELSDEEVFGADPETTGSVDQPPGYDAYAGAGAPGELSDEEVFGPAAKQQAAPGELSDEEVFGPAERQPWSQAATIPAKIAEGAIPSGGAAAAALWSGAKAARMAAPLGPWPALGVGLAAGLATAVGAGTVLDAAQQKVMELLGLEKVQQTLNEMQQDNPDTSDLAKNAPALVFMRPDLKNVAAASRAISGAAAGAFDAGSKFLHDPDADFNAKTFTGNVIGGALFHTTNRIGSKIIGSGHSGVPKDPTKTGQAGEQVPANEISEEELVAANQTPSAAGGTATEQRKAPLLPDVTGQPKGEGAGAENVAETAAEKGRYAKGNAAWTGNRPSWVPPPRASDSKVIENPVSQGDAKDGEVFPPPRAPDPELEQRPWTAEDAMVNVTPDENGRINLGDIAPDEGAALDGEILPPRGKADPQVEIDNAIKDVTLPDGRIDLTALPKVRGKGVANTQQPLEGEVHNKPAPATELEKITARMDEIGHRRNKGEDYNEEYARLEKRYDELMHGEEGARPNDIEDAEYTSSDHALPAPTKALPNMPTGRGNKRPPMPEPDENGMINLEDVVPLTDNGPPVNPNDVPPAMKRSLQTLGVSDEKIAGMTAAEARARIRQGVNPEPPQGPVDTGLVPKPNDGMIDLRTLAEAQEPLSTKTKPFDATTPPAEPPGAAKLKKGRKAKEAPASVGAAGTPRPAPFDLASIAAEADAHAAGKPTTLKSLSELGQHVQGQEKPPVTAPVTKNGLPPSMLKALRQLKVAEEDIAKMTAEQAQERLTKGFSDFDAEAGPVKPKGAGAPKRERGPEKLTKEEAAYVDNYKASLARFPKVIAALDKLPPRDQFDYISNADHEAVNEQIAAAEGKVIRPDGRVRVEPEKPKTEGGAKTVSLKAQARADKASEGYKYLYHHFGPDSPAGKAIDPANPMRKKETREYTMRVYDAMKTILGGDPFSTGSKVYVPRKRTDEVNEIIQWLKAVKQSALGKDQRNFTLMHLVKGMGKEDRITGKIDKQSRINRPDENAAETHKAQEENEKGSDMGSGVLSRRRELKPFKDKDEAPRFVAEKNKLYDWINNLEDTDFILMKNEHPEMERNARVTQDPAKLLALFEDDLKAAQIKRPAGELEPRVRIRTRDTAEPPPKDEIPKGIKLDPKSDVWQEAAEQAHASMTEATKKKGEQLNDLNWKIAEARKLQENPMQPPGTMLKGGKGRSGFRPLTDYFQTEAEKLVAATKALPGDEAGGISLPDFNGILRRWWSPPQMQGPVQGPEQYVHGLLKDRLWKNTADTVNRKVELGKKIKAMADDKTMSAADHTALSRAEQDNRIGALPQHIQDFYRTHVVPIRDEQIALLKEFKQFSIDNDLGYDIEKVNLNAVTTKSHQPRFQVESINSERKQGEGFDPMTGRGFGDFNVNAEDRKMFSLENGPQREVVSIERNHKTGELEMMIHRGLNASGQVKTVKLKNLPIDFEGKIGDELSRTNRSGQSEKWQIGQATTEEITKATGGKLKYVENAGWAWTKALDNTQRALDNAKLLVAIKNDPAFKHFSTTDWAVAEKNGWSRVGTHLPELNNMGGHNKQPLYMADQLRWAFDDYHKPGFGGNSSEGIEAMRNFNIAMLKVFNTNAPLVHVLNELDLFIVGRGFKWANPIASYNLVKDIPSAMRSVNTQDHLQARMRNAGVNPMLASVGIRTVMEKAARKMGVELQKNHASWDPLAKATGVSLKEVGQGMYDLSSDVTWRLSDYLTTLRFMEEIRAGFSDKEAADRVNGFMSDYQLNSTMLFKGRMGRVIQQFVSEQAITSFGRYKAGTFKTLGKMTGGLLGPNSTKAERTEALGQWLVAGAMLYWMYPAINAGLQALTDNEGAKLRPRGINALLSAPIDIWTGEKDASAATVRAWTPSPMINVGIEVAKNESFGGQKIIPQGEWPDIAPDAMTSLAEYALRTVVPPYGVVSGHYSRPENEGWGDPAWGLVADQFGVSLPSDAANKRSDKMDKINQQKQRQRDLYPKGVIPAAGNWLKEKLGLD